MVLSRRDKADTKSNVTYDLWRAIMCEIVLEIPTARHTLAANVYYKDFLHLGKETEKNVDLSWIKDYQSWLGNSYRNSRESIARKDWVPNTTLFAVRKADNKIIGSTHIRHNLDREILRTYGGHIGYAVCPGERGKGYGTAILELALDYCIGLDLNHIMLSCDKENFASKRIIEKCGGVFERSYRTEGREILVYQINL